MAPIISQYIAMTRILMTTNNNRMKNEKEKKKDCEILKGYMFFATSILVNCESRLWEEGQ